jgi:hypothetical protein
MTVKILSEPGMRGQSDEKVGSHGTGVRRDDVRRAGAELERGPGCTRRHLQPDDDGFQERARDPQMARVDGAPRLLDAARLVEPEAASPHVVFAQIRHVPDALFGFLSRRLRDPRHELREKPGTSGVAWLHQAADRQRGGNTRITVVN